MNGRRGGAELARLIERSEELKRDLVDFACSPRLERSLAAAVAEAGLDRNRKKDTYEGFGIPAYWIVESSSDRPELTVFELRSGAYEQTAHVIGSEGTARRFRSR